ncbi:MAG: alpha/beta fold hydrolase [Sphingomonadales bacterium]|jgi:DNA-binding CsgD family transcriptional regulator|nr:alpha/beta fold hydrolase [Sphingomonadales bacterium]
MSRAQAFLEKFREAEAQDAPLAVLADDPDGWGDALKSAHDDVAQAFEQAGTRGHGPAVTLHADCFATAACDRDGSVLVADPGFEQWFDSIDPFDAVIRDLRNDGPRVSLLADDSDGRPVALAAGTYAVTRRWPLSEDVRKALDSGKAAYAIAAFRAGELSWDHAARSYGLTPAEAGLVSSLARLGDLQRAARERNIAYETARKFVASALAKTGAKRQTELVRLALMMTAGDIPDAQNLALVLTDLFGMTERQAQLSVVLAQGATRERAAQIVGISDNRAKADLKAVFQACGVDNAVDLARIVAEINALKGLASACEVMVSGPGREGEPLRLVPRRSGEGRIAMADHGPTGAQPVLIMHSSVTGRHHSPRFIQRLQSEGFRPITMDRAGFGLSDRVEGDLAQAGVADIADVLDSLGLSAIPVVARCTMAGLIACEAGRAGLLSGGILVWPDAPLPEQAPERRRMTDRAAQLFANHPKMAWPFVEMLCRRATSGAMEKLWRKAAEGLPSDLALFDDPEECAAIVRSSRQAMQGMHGFFGEVMAMRKGPKLDPVPDATRWTALFGSGYESYDVTDGVTFWSSALPGGAIRVVDDGVHFLHLTHTDEVVAALKRAIG